MSTAMTTPAPYRTDILYDRETHQYAFYLDQELIGFARTYHEAEVTLDQLIFELIHGRYFATDPGGPPPPGDDIPGPDDPIPPPRSVEVQP